LRLKERAFRGGGGNPKKKKLLPRWGGVLSMRENFVRGKLCTAVSLRIAKVFAGACKGQGKLRNLHAVERLREKGSREGLKRTYVCWE